MNPSIKGIEKVATAYLQVVHCYEEAAAAQAAGKEKEADYWNNAGRAYYNLAIELAKPEQERQTDVKEMWKLAADFRANATMEKAKGNSLQAAKWNA